jgi:hypothetical protein
MSDPRPATTRALFAGTLLVIAGLAFWALYVTQSGSERHSYTRGGSPPPTVRLVQGHTYWIAIPGGVAEEARRGIDPAALQCTAARPGQAPGALNIAPEQRDSKAIDRIASFVSGINGTVQVQCTGLGTVYVDNAADASFDWSGLWLVLASLALVVGLPLTLSALRGAGLRGRAERQDSAQPDVGGIDPAAERVL